MSTAKDEAMDDLTFKKAEFSEQTNSKKRSIHEALRTDEKEAKRQRMLKTVRFSQEEQEAISNPYCSDMTDAEALQMFHKRIWYSPWDYLSFLKDRIDTVRVYKSVNGQMSYLSNHYSTRGLEHLLESSEHYSRYQKVQKELREAVVKRLNEGCDSETIRTMVTTASTTAMSEALRRAAIPEDSNDRGESSDECESDSDVRCESPRGMCTGNSSRSKTRIDVVLGEKTLPLDLLSLRKMNSQLVENMRSIDPSSISFSYSADRSAADASRRLLQSALGNGLKPRHLDLQSVCASLDSTAETEKPGTEVRS